MSEKYRVLEAAIEAQEQYLHYDAERRRRIIQARALGVSAEEIAAALGLRSSGTVRKFIERERLGLSPGHGKARL